MNIMKSKKFFSSSLYAILSLIFFIFSQPTFSTEAEGINITANELKGAIKIYKRYCSKCHGKEGKGDGRMNKLYIKLRINAPSNFTIGYFEYRSAEYLKRIIVEGGEGNNRSKYMPPFKDELTDEQINTLVKLIQLTGKNHKLIKKVN